MTTIPTTRKLLPTLLAAVLGSSGAQAGIPFNQVIAFGASFEDIGQFPDYDFPALAGLVPPPGAGLDGSTGLRFTNLDAATGQRGRAWVEQMSEAIGAGAMAPSTPILFPGERSDIPDTANINFAFGGGRSEASLAAVTGISEVEHPVDALVPFDLTASSPGLVQRLEAGSLSISGRTLFVANPAGNDVRDADPASAEADGVAAAQGTLAVVQALVDAGARNILLPTFPPLGLLSESSNVAPDGSRTDKALARNEAAAAYNRTMAAALPGVSSNIILVDFAGLLLEVLEDPAAYGFSGQIDHSRYCYTASEWTLTGVNCTEPEGLGKSSGGNPANFIANDGLHPTQGMTAILADYTTSVLAAPGMMGLLPETVLGDSRAFANTITDYQLQRRWGRQPGGLDVFASVQGESADYEDTKTSPAASSDAVDLTLGAAWSINANWFAGGAIGSQQSELDLDRGGSSFDSDSLLGSLFFGYRGKYLATDFSLTMGKSDLEDIRRVVTLGDTNVRRMDSETEADILGLSATIAVDTTADDATLRFGPFLALDYYDIEVDGFSEAGNSSTSMGFEDQNRESLLGSAGIFASYPFRWGSTAMEVYGDLAYRYESEESTDDVVAYIKPLGREASFSMPGYDVDRESVAVRGGLKGNFGKLRANLFAAYDNNDRETTYYGLGVAYNF